MIRLSAALALIFLLPQDPASPNLQPPSDIPEAAVQADRKGWELIEQFKKEGKDRGLLTQAIEQFLKADAAAKKPFPLVWYHMGVAYQLTEEYLEARRRLERAVEVNPKFHEALLELGDTYGWLKQFDLAINAYDRALKLKPTYAAALRNKAMTLMKKGDYAGAQKAADGSLEIEPDDPYGKELKKIADREVKGPQFAKEFKKETDHFVIVTDVDDKFAAWIGRHIELIFKKYNSIFPPVGKSWEKFRVIVFATEQEYLEYGSPPRTGGYYQPLTKKLCFWRQPNESDTLLVLYHETFHQFLDYYLDGAPQWFNEGHGDYFGPSRYDEKTKQMEIRTNPWRLKFIKDAIVAGAVQPFSKIMQMTQWEMYNPRTIGLNYAQAWSMVYFFWHYQKGKYGPLLQAYFKQLMKGDGLAESFKAVWAKQDLDKIQKEWAEFIVGLE